MSALTYVPQLGKASSCVLALYHSPKPLRFVWHHILPQTCGGTLDPANLASVCDSCHYSVHILLWELGQNGGNVSLLKHGTKKQKALALEGYNLCVANGTVGKIPKEA